MKIHVVQTKHNQMMTSRTERFVDNVYLACEKVQR